MRDPPAHRALDKLVESLGRARIPYAICGGLAASAYGSRRGTPDVSVLLTEEGLATFKERYLGLGYVERFPGSRGLRDPEHGVAVDVLITGGYPGDSKPGPVSFPDPADVAKDGEGCAIIALPALIALKLASGMTAAHRGKDLTDVFDLIRLNDLPRDLALPEYVTQKYLELWEAAQNVGEDY